MDSALPDGFTGYDPKPQCSEDAVRDGCGVCGLFVPGEDVARATYFALYALQHRGQESAGIAVSDGRELRCYKQMGLLSQVFTEDILSGLPGYLSVGHTRYSTTGSSVVYNAQPLLTKTPVQSFALAHNGNLVNTEALRDQFPEDQARAAGSDSEVMARMIAEFSSGNIESRIVDVMQRCIGAFSIVLATETQLFGFRDPWGIRPLCVGRYGDGWMLASESCALNTVGAEFVREVEPGEIIIIDKLGMRSRSIETGNKAANCIFEYIYFSRPDTTFKGHELYLARYRMGRAIAREAPAAADVVIGVPDSATAAAIGFADESGLPYIEGLMKNRYIGRTFISPDQNMRAQGVKLKFNPLIANLKGKRIVLVDDSIVRGTTTRQIVSLLRRSGASQVHVRITSPPMRHPCFLGVDTATYDQLIAASHSVPEICQTIGADSLGYLSQEGLVEATGRPRTDFCMGCFTGTYPEGIHEQLTGKVRELAEIAP
ncbi:MAG: amidophosphoribosyltransferase [Candidatus Eremiobacter antarcticus]|nr:amidophosphoribosyltransferase [Candidatus Eremiobacteraeota bacterium]MBC5809058.1 amidophosphoribosyltransferase [Candidatus Eremiobacteraeota bacterium]PZR64365.1 MAG: amidophosphoribosyltransferase [Candidatus Eremiobacter sp. RRmetagenome_bin22]